MTHTYPETYLNSAMGKLADVFDIAVNDFSLDADAFAKQFACSKTCRRLENGDPSILLGKSGPEILFEYFAEEGRVVVREAHGVSPQYNRTPEYWAGCSQSQLAKMSGVSLRSIQMYEQRNKDINKAQAETLLRLARTLGCRMEDLLESDIAEQ